jgi:small-conductance mechanosensitive channel/CRP-like cAMP-binding protein
MLFANSDLFGWTLFDGKVILAGIALIVLLLVFVRGPARRKIRWVILFLGLHLVLLGIRHFAPEDAPLRTTLRSTAFFLLMSSIGLGLFLLLTSSTFSLALFSPLPKIFMDLAQGFVYLVALMITLGAAGVQTSELFAGSALLTAVIGLSLRDTLGNLFAGLAIQAQRPFEVGDWIQFNQDPAQAGQVTEINWRATRVVTSDRVEIIVPNSFLAQSPIVNFSQPEAAARRQVFVHAPYGTRPQRVKAILLAAMNGAPGVLTSPAPSVTTTGFDDRGTQFCVLFYLDDFGNRGRIESVVRDRVWYALGRHGIVIPVPPRDVRVHKAGKSAVERRKKKHLARRVHAITALDFLGQLPPEARRRLAGRARTRLFSEQEIIIQQGSLDTDLFILESGEVVVTVKRPDETDFELARMGPGSFFGEMAALTGDPRRATVRASKECEVLVIDKAALAEVLASTPDVADHVSRTIAQREAILLSQLSEHGPHPIHPVDENSHRLLQRIKEFFSM